MNPSPQTRLSLGVGELVNISGDGNGWDVSGDGTLSSDDPGPTVLTAGSEAGQVTVTEAPDGVHCTLNSVVFDVEAPISITYVQAENLKHTQGLDDIGLLTDFYLQPADVSFENVYMQEEQAYAQVQATPSAYACEAGLGHLMSPTPSPFRVAEPTNATDGSQVQAAGLCLLGLLHLCAGDARSGYRGI